VKLPFSGSDILVVFIAPTRFWQAYRQGRPQLQIQQGTLPGQF